jgi:predicted TIM-barrel fold metal-dependent hydrolase
MGRTHEILVVLLLIDCHAHILTFGEPQVATTFMREAMTCVLRTQGKLPVHQMPTEEDWKRVGLGGEPTTPEQLLKDFEMFDKVVILAVSPHRWPDGMLGTVDTVGVTNVPGPPTPEKCNDYIADIAKTHSSKLIGFASVNPTFKGTKAAVRELERAITKLGLTGLKLYPTYQHWSPDDRELAFPVFEKAEELDIPVLVHMGGSTVIDPPLKFSRPTLLDDVGREFRKLRLIIGHMGIPWIKESLYLMTKHPNFYGDLSYHIGSIDRESLYRFLLNCKDFFVPWGKLFFGSDYPGYDVMKLVNMLKTVNQEAERLGGPKIPEHEIQGILGDNFAKVVDIND